MMPKPSIKGLVTLLWIVILLTDCPSPAMENLEVNGFFEVRAGSRTRNDPHEKDLSVMDTRLQVEVFTYNDLGDFKYKGDLWGDGITEQGEYDTREAWVFLRPFDTVDLKLGRQVLTWGTGDLVFLNDLFPKDWQSFFIGRDDEYLKAPSDAVKLSLFTNLASVDIVYTPKFDPDRFITGKYISHWNAREQRLSGQNALVDADRPDQWFRDDEISVRIYKNINNYEYALYGYSGFWKRPAGESLEGKAIFPRLNVYGLSARGQLGSGIGNMELAWYDSRDDEGGANAMVDNSEMRYLIGYTRDLAKDLNASLQYYVEQMRHYREYKQSLTKGHARDRARHVITLQLTKLLMNQNLELALSAYFSPSDEDALLRPNISYKINDSLVVEAGANIFSGSDTHTFFAQFENDTNIYTAVRYSL
jgi:hypothetical protein